MKATNEYRIIDDMGWYYPQRKYLGWRERALWESMKEWMCGSFGEGCWFEQRFCKQTEAEKYLRDKIAANKLKEKQMERGRVVVKEIKG